MAMVPGSRTMTSAKSTTQEVAAVPVRQSSSTQQELRNPPLPPAPTPPQAAPAAASAPRVTKTPSYPAQSHGPSR